MDTLQQEIENLEKENQGLKEQMRNMSKKALLHGIAGHSAGMYFVFLNKIVYSIDCDFQRNTLTNFMGYKKSI